ncbi:MAG: hypothetical protein H0T73_08250 [Ardenticatenales bacterium]|nr:hypothetical protein [Ardenticatenales bacterium]
MTDMDKAELTRQLEVLRARGIAHTQRKTSESKAELDADVRSKKRLWGAEQDWGDHLTPEERREQAQAVRNRVRTRLEAGEMEDPVPADSTTIVGVQYLQRQWLCTPLAT